MKKILLTALCGILLGASQVNAKDFIVPYQLTEQDSGGYHFVNLASEKMFKNLIPRIRIDTRKISDTYNENLIPNKQNKYQNPNYYYVQYRYAELLYNKKTNDLTAVSVEKLSNPKSDAIYDYPSGRLKYIQIYDGASNDFVQFMPYGSLYTDRAYMSDISLQLTRRLNKNLSAKPETPVKIYLDINSDGEIVKCELQHASGKENIDNEILDIIKDTAPFDKFPPKFPKHLEMLLEYKVNNN